ncbi:hypothetical protein [Pseudoalteromonas ruthenica]|uniref:hypothetical protein n=1 Tax=Pseudoalteromonas ruthenica TaxID=151081 RepID=UPI0003479606|nr:hypothetical protein [Pseudoalteromonas ruthenica]
MIEFLDYQLDNFVWTNRFGFSGVAQQEERGLNGAFHIESTPIDVGRPITLSSQTAEPAGRIMPLMELARTTLGAFPLVINGVSYTVKFYHNPNAVVIQTDPDFFYSDADPDWFANVTLHFITV